MINISVHRFRRLSYCTYLQKGEHNVLRQVILIRCTVSETFCFISYFDGIHI